MHLFCLSERSPAELLDRSPLEELRDRAAEVRFGAAQCGLALLRYLTDHAQRTSPAVLARIVSRAEILAVVAGWLAGSSCARPT
jgi:hypothetical protein